MPRDQEHNFRLNSWLLRPITDSFLGKQYEGTLIRIPTPGSGLYDNKGSSPTGFYTCKTLSINVEWAMKSYKSSNEEEKRTYPRKIVQKTRRLRTTLFKNSKNQLPVANPCGRPTIPKVTNG
ncbi:hypothetical protein VNO77_44387 [Canavalia gladiata]|uniref:Uncharacterized protein n=1 Tax=Canavalia gladiata TaxID=3824 RepID=A0AAN9JWM8_CANGL